jgi:hypothetical protein
MKRFSLLGICKHMHDTARMYDLRAEKASHDFCTKQVSAIAHLPQLKRFPYPVQLMIVGEMDKAEEAEECMERPRHGLADEVTCACVFWRRYQLPCCHILQHHMIFGHLTDKHWSDWAFAWEDSGFEIYETATKTYVNKEMYEEIGAPVRRKLELREVIDSLTNRYYRLEEELEDWPDIERDIIIKGWIRQLECMVGPIRKQAANDLLAMLDPERQQFVRDSQRTWSQRNPTVPSLPTLEPLVDSENDGSEPLEASLDSEDE